MRYIFYIPEGESVADYKDQWEQKTNEVHSGMSKSIEGLVEDPEKAQFVEIPEYQFARVQKNVASKDYISYNYVDDFVDQNDLPQYIMEVWKKNLDNPSEPEEKIDQHFMQYEKIYRWFYTDHINLNAGWYNLVFKKDDEEVEVKEITVYDAYEEE